MNEPYNCCYIRVCVCVWGSGGTAAAAGLSSLREATQGDPVVRE